MSKERLSFILNGVEQDLLVEPSATLVDVLRNHEQGNSSSITS